MKTKNFTQITLFLFGLLFIFIGCKKTDDPGKSETVTDIDGNVYQTVTIGTQVWLAENLKTTHFQNGDKIPNVTDNQIWRTLKTAALCDYNNSPTASFKYGKLYNWYCVADERSLAPEGFRVSTNEDWNILINYLGGESVAGGKLKEKGLGQWLTPNFNATNLSKFTALPSGGRHDHGEFSGMGEGSEWWTTNDPETLSDENACTYYISYDEESITTAFASRTLGRPVRCLKK